MRLVFAALAAAACALTAAAEVHVGPTGMQGPIGKPQTTNVQCFFPSFLNFFFFFSTEKLHTTVCLLFAFWGVVVYVSST